MNGLKISWETADNITVDNLTDLYNFTEADMIMYKDGTKWMHEDDVKEYKKLLKAISRILKYYGKDPDTSRIPNKHQEW